LTLRQQKSVLTSTPRSPSPQSHSSLGLLTSPLKENVLCVCLDTFEERLFAGGDGGVVRCWDTNTFEEISGVAEDISAWKEKMQDGCMSAYSMVHFDPYEKQQRQIRMKRGFLEREGGKLDCGRGNLIIGNLNGDVVIWDLEVKAVSALLISNRQDEYLGACNAVAVVKRGGGGRERIVSLAGEGREAHIWSSKDVWDSVPEVEGR
jgi:hypothetical protein